MSSLKTIIVDDEELARKRLKRLLSAHSSYIEIIDEAKNGLEAVEKINNHRPDLIFLDIQMPGLNGFQVLENLNGTKPKVIFATAYDQYAIKAFDENSVDYLLKPIEKDRLSQAIDKLKDQSSDSLNSQLVEKLLSQLNPKKTIQSISVKQGEKIKIISLEDIAYFKASGKYVILSDKDSEQYVTSHSLKSLMDQLPEEVFLQISRSILVNRVFVSELEKYFNGKYKIKLKDDKATVLESSTGYTQAVKDFVGL